VSPREQLVSRIVREAHAYAAADYLTRDLRLGRVQGLLEAGVIAGYWTRRDAEAAAELVRHRYRVSGLRRLLVAHR
jgi:hypothetical protein